MRKILLIALLVAWAPAAARADYDARKSEALAELARAEMTAEERTALRATLDRYFTAREDCLEALVAIVAKKEENEQDPMFVARAGMCQSGGAQILGDALDGIADPTLGAFGFLNVFAAHEAAFYQSLAGTTVGDARDQIVVIRIRLDDMTEALDEMWETLLGEDKLLDERAEKIIGEIRADYDAVIRQAADANPDIAEVIADGVRRWAESETSPTPTTPSVFLNSIIEGVKPVLGLLIQLWQSTNTRGETRVRTYKALFTSEIRILVMFEDVRADVKEFLEDNDWPRAEAAYASARSSLDTFVSAAKTSGLSSDASELRGDLMEQLAIHLKEGADIYATFVSDNKGRFVGALGPDIEEALVEHRAWEQYASYIEGYGLDAKLRDWHQHGTNYFGVDLSPLSSKARDELKNGLRGIIDQLLKELKTAEEAYRAIDALIEEEREDVEDEVD